MIIISQDGTVSPKDGERYKIVGSARVDVINMTGGRLDYCDQSSGSSSGQTGGETYFMETGVN